MTIEEELNNADALIEQGDFPAAISAFSKIIEEDPQCDEAWLMLGSLYGETGQTDKAIEYIEQAISLKPEDGFAYLTLGHIKNATGDKDSALTAFAKAAKYEPDNTETLCTLASFQQQQGDINGAIANYERAVEINETLYNAWKTLGPLHFLNNNLEAAEACYRKATTLNSNDPETFLGICSLLNHLDRSGDVIDLLKQLPEEAKSDAEVLLQFAVANSKQGLHNEAIEYIDKAIEINPSDRFILGKADVLERKGELENVFETLKPFLEKKPPNPAAVILFSKFSDTLDLNQECMQLLDIILSDNTQPSLVIDQASQARDWINSRNN